MKTVANCIKKKIDAGNMTAFSSPNKTVSAAYMAIRMGRADELDHVLAVSNASVKILENNAKGYSLLAMCVRFQCSECVPVLRKYDIDTTELDAGGLPGWSPGMRMEGVKGLNRILDQLPGLKVLNLYSIGNPRGHDASPSPDSAASSGGLEDGWMAHISQSLKHMRQLRVLNLGRTSLGPWDMDAWAPKLSMMTQLEELVLSGNAMGTKTEKVLLDALSTLHSLRKLDLSQMSLSDKGISILAEALPSLFTVRDLNLAGNQPGLQSVQLLSKAFKAFPEMRRLDLSDFGLGSLLVEAMIPALKGMKRLRALHIVENNALCSATTFSVKVGAGLMVAISKMTELEDLDLRRYCDQNAVVPGAEWRGNIASALKNLSALRTFNTHPVRELGGEGGLAAARAWNTSVRVF